VTRKRRILESFYKIPGGGGKKNKVAIRVFTRDDARQPFGVYKPLLRRWETEKKHDNFSSPRVSKHYRPPMFHITPPINGKRRKIQSILKGVWSSKGEIAFAGKNDGGTIKNNFLKNLSLGKRIDGHRKSKGGKGGGERPLFTALLTIPYHRTRTGTVLRSEVLHWGGGDRRGDPSSKPRSFFGRMRCKRQIG